MDIMGVFFPGNLQKFTFGSIQINLLILTPVMQAVKISLQKLIGAGVINCSIESTVILKENNS